MAPVIYYSTSKSVNVQHDNAFNVQDNDLNMRIYSEEQDDVHNETWQVVVT